MPTPAEGVELRGRVCDSIVDVTVAPLPDFAERCISTALGDGL